MESATAPHLAFDIFLLKPYYVTKSLRQYQELRISGY